jgi:hypothetical protein
VSRDKNVRKENTRSCHKTTKQPASGIVVTETSACVAGADACMARAIYRSPPATDDIWNHQSPPTTTEHDRLWPSRASSGIKLLGVCWPRAEQEGPLQPWLDTIGPEEAGNHHGRARVKRKPAEDHRSSSKDILKFCTARQNLRRRHYERPLPLTNG